MSREAKTFWLCVLKGIAITIGGLLATALVFTLLQLRVTFLHVCLAYLCFLVVVCTELILSKLKEGKPGRDPEDPDAPCPPPIADVFAPAERTVPPGQFFAKCDGISHKERRSFLCTPTKPKNFSKSCHKTPLSNVI